MPDTGEALKIWQALRPMIDKEIAEQTESCVRAKKMIVKQATVQNEDGSVSLGVAEPYNDKVMIPSGDELSNVNPGSPVWVYWYFNNASTMHVALNGDGTQGSAVTDRLLEMLNKEIADREKADNELYAYIDATASHLRIEFEDGLNSLRSYIELTSSKLRLEFEDELNSLRSFVEITASGLRLEFYDDMNSLRSYLEMTASRLRIEFYDDLNGLRSYLEMTASHLRAEFYDDINGLRSYLELTASHLRAEFYDDMNSLRSYLELTASHLRAEFYDDMNSLRSYLELTASHLRTEFYDDVNSLRSYVEITASHLRTEFYDDISSLRSYVEITASHLRAEYYDDMNSMRSYVELTASYLRTEFYNDISSLRSYVEITASHLSAEFFDDINSLRSYVEVQAGKIDMNVAATGENSSILRQAGMYINDQGVLVYATDNQNNIGSKLNVLSNEISAKVGKSEVVITDDSITIGSQSISFQGYVTIEDLAAEIADIANLEVQSLNASGSVDCGTILATNADLDYINGTSMDHISDAVYSFGTPTSSGGQISIPYTKLGGGTGNINFNIADTQFYQDGVAAARPHSLSTITLGSGDTGNSTQTVTVFCLDDEEYDLNTTVNASAVYNAGKSAMGVAVDTANHTIYATESATKSVAVSLQNTIAYSESGHNYVGVISAIAGGAYVQTDSFATGTEAYEAGWNDNRIVLISDITLSSSDTGTSYPLVTLTRLIGTTYRRSITVDASAVYSAGRNSVTLDGSMGLNSSYSPTYYPSAQAISVSVVGTLTNGNPVGGTVLISGGAVQDAYNAGWAAAKSAISISGNKISGPSSTVGSSEVLYTITADAIATLRQSDPTTYQARAVANADVNGTTVATATDYDP